MSSATGFSASQWNFLALAALTVSLQTSDNAFWSEQTFSLKSLIDNLHHLALGFSPSNRKCADGHGQRSYWFTQRAVRTKCKFKLFVLKLEWSQQHWADVLTVFFTIHHGARNFTLRSYNHCLKTFLCSTLKFEFLENADSQTTCPVLNIWDSGALMYVIFLSVKALN